MILLNAELDRGKSEAIELALQQQRDLLLLDDAEGRGKARLYGLKYTGAVRLLLQAKLDGKLPSLRGALDALQDTGTSVTCAACPSTHSPPTASWVKPPVVLGSGFPLGPETHPAAALPAENGRLAGETSGLGYQPIAQHAVSSKRVESVKAIAAPRVAPLPPAAIATPNSKTPPLAAPQAPDGKALNAAKNHNTGWFLLLGLLAAAGWLIYDPHRHRRRLTCLERDHQAMVEANANLQKRIDQLQAGKMREGQEQPEATEALEQGAAVQAQPALPLPPTPTDAGPGKTQPSLSRAQLGEITQAILDEIKLASQQRMAADDLRNTIDAKLNLALGGKPGDCHIYDSTLETEVAHQGWYYLLFLEGVAEAGFSRQGLLFVAPGIALSAKMTEYFDGGFLSEPIVKNEIPALKGARDEIVREFAECKILACIRVRKCRAS